ncbi:MAG: hypothetical protein HZB11_00165 [Candidatus Yonathbacteria bacterium]|nr:hypothetical protein [Candidatus Yonathbacteria bacterium]
MLFIVVAVTQSDLRFFIPAAVFGILAFFSAYYAGKGRMLTEKEMPKIIYPIEGEMIFGKHDVVIVRDKTSKLRVCVSNKDGFDMFDIKGDKERFLVPKNR